MKKFSAVNRTGNKWDIWEHIENCKRQICTMSSDDILQLFNETVPRTVEKPFLIGDTGCKHAWRPWKFNDNFIICVHCPAMKKVIKLVPKEYKNGNDGSIH